MITTLHIQNYRSIREMSLELEQLNIVFGPNGTGKSNIYKAIHLMHSAAQGQFSQALANEGGILKVFWAGKTRSDQLRRMNLAVETETYEYELQVGFVEKRHCCKVSDEAAFCLIQRPYISKTLLTRR
ncbi:TPA: AAA family ATPase, partial [Escherichia coli]